MTIENHIFRKVGPDVQARINALPIGGKMQDLPVELWHESFRRYVLETPNRGGGPNMRIIRLDPNQPSLTVTGFIFNKFVHPLEDRYVTVREAARLQGFPDHVHFQGSLGSTQQQVGNAVPPPLAQAVLQATASAIGVSRKSPIDALSLFAGAGGFDIGAEQVPGVRTRMATDIWDDATETLKSAVTKRTRVVQADISKIDRPLSFWRANCDSVKPQLIYGGPPCQSFSQAGKQRAEEDERGQLIFEYLRFVEALRPRAFVLENVSNIRGVAGGRLLAKILKRVDELGYDGRHTILSAADFGVPQRRRRFFLVAIRKSEHANFLWPQPTHSSESDGLFSLDAVATVGDAFKGLPAAKPAGK
jgi:DNA (cytosine-5)-methyltransferase 1